MAKVSKKSKRRLLLLGPFALFAIGYFLVTFTSYMISYSSLYIEEKKLKNELVELQNQKANLKIEIIKLNDPNYVARYAKENYLYSSENEYVLKIDEEIQQNNIEQDEVPVFIYVILSIFIILTIILIKKKSSK